MKMTNPFASGEYNDKLMACIREQLDGTQKGDKNGAISVVLNAVAL
jgi:hypothetical protein